MFIGHYAAAPLAAATGKIKLWQAFVAVQFVDFIWAVFILIGIEKARIVPGLTQASPLDLHFMPYTHSLLFTLGWAFIAALAFKAFTSAKGWGGAALIAALVLSHWAGDVIVHIPDMTWWPGSDKIGLGLWRTVMVSFPLELVIALGALWIYVAKTKPASPRSKFWTTLLVAFLVILQSISNFGSAPGSVSEAAITALIAFTLIAFAASRYEQTRIIE